MKKSKPHARGGSHIILGVLMGVTILVGAAAVVAYTIFFPPRFRGWGEVTADGRVAGWAVDEKARGRRVEVQLYVDGRFVGAGRAELSRPDVVAAGRAADARCGYSFALPPLAAGEHEARVYATHTVAGGAYRTLILTGRPLSFTVGENGVVKPPGNR